MSIFYLTLVMTYNRLQMVSFENSPSCLEKIDNSVLKFSLQQTFIMLDRSSCRKSYLS